MEDIKVYAPIITHEVSLSTTTATTTAASALSPLAKTNTNTTASIANSTSTTTTTINTNTITSNDNNTDDNDNNNIGNTNIDIATIINHHHQNNTTSATDEEQDREPMAIIPVPDSAAIMGVPIATINGLLSSQLRRSLKAEMDARDLLIWNDGIGILDGCDLRFKINQSGCLELLDSDDEEGYDLKDRNKRNKILMQQQQQLLKQQQRENFTPSNAITSPDLDNHLHHNDHHEQNHHQTNDQPSLKRQKATDTGCSLITNQTTNINNDNCHAGSIRQISPGSSLLKGGPSIRRPSKVNQAAFIRKIENSQNSALLDKILPKERVESLKGNVKSWTSEEVKQFIDSLPGCSGYGQVFEAQEICGESLLYLDQKDLLDVINVKLGPAVKIYHAISLLK